MQPQIFEYGHTFNLESGSSLPGFRLAYTTHGSLNAERNNVIWVFHALTANSNPAEWWPGIVGSGKLFDPERFFIICVNMPGSCYGSSGPLDKDPATGEPWFHGFPFFTPRDMARAYRHLRLSLGIEGIFAGIGGSMGGQQLLEWAVEEPELFRHIIPMATNAFHSAWGRAFNASQRMCIETDPTWQERSPVAGMQGLKTARSVALLSYRHYRTYVATQQDGPDVLEHFRSESYQRYQGEKLAARFNAFSYYALTKGMDAHNLGRSRGTVTEALGRIRAKTLVIGIDTDLLYPVEEQAYLARQIDGASLAVLESLYGHDAFLLEYEKLEGIIAPFLGIGKKSDFPEDTPNKGN
jgi:homoserine O-acetyltransferase